MTINNPTFSITKTYTQYWLALFPQELQNWLDRFFPIDSTGLISEEELARLNKIFFLTLRTDFPHRLQEKLLYKWTLEENTRIYIVWLTEYGLNMEWRSVIKGIWPMDDYGYISLRADEIPIWTIKAIANCIEQISNQLNPQIKSQPLPS